MSHNLSARILKFRTCAFALEVFETGSIQQISFSEPVQGSNCDHDPKEGDADGKDLRGGEGFVRIAG